MANSFELVLTVDNESLKILKGAQQYIVLAKPITATDPVVAWQAFDPFPINSVSWTEEYGLYASNTLISNGATIVKTSQVDKAESGSYYTLDANSLFNGPFSSGGIPPGAYRISNAMPAVSYPALTFGLTQSANVNGQRALGRPINAQIVPSNQTATFTPLTTVQVWLHTLLLSGTVLTEVISKSTSVTFGGSITKQELVYDPNRGMFVPKAPSASAFGLIADAGEEMGHVKLFAPAVT